VNPRELASFPFLREAAEFVRAKGPSLDELVSDMAYAEVRGAGVERVTAALEQGILPFPSCRGERECLNEMLTYICARFVVSAAGSQALVRRYALAEAKRAGKLLGMEPVETVLAVAEELGIPAQKGEGSLMLHFPHYLKYAVRHEKQWKLINRRLRHGMVELQTEELCRIIEEAVRRRFESELPFGVPDPVKEAFREPAAALRTDAEARLRKFQPKDMGKIRVDCFPPCIRHLLAMAQSGENVPHSGRFALVTFFHALGVSEQEMMKSFSTSPDFQEDKTRYQVEHITGVTSGTEYSPPGCDTMKTYGLCLGPDSLCGRDWMTHPLKYYMVKMKPRKGTTDGSRQKGSRQQGTKETDGQQAALQRAEGNDDGGKAGGAGQ
jgi:DNA primase large subunit